jgi:hypothetical protein
MDLASSSRQDAGAPLPPHGCAVHHISFQVRDANMPKASSHFWWLPTSLSIVLSTLGLVSLAQHAFVTWSLSAPIALIMDAYTATTRLLFGWAEPYLLAALNWFASFIGWRPTLYPHWRDMLVVATLALAAYHREAVASSRREGKDDMPWRSTTALGAAAFGWAIFFGLVAGKPGEVQLVLLALVCAVAFFGVFGIFLGRLEATVPPEFAPRFLAMGLTILGGYVGAFFVLAVDAGLKLLGA